MFEYKSEIMKVRYDMLWPKSRQSESERDKFDAFINQKVAEGWELVCYSESGIQDTSSTTILLTFRRQKD